MTSILSKKAYATFLVINSRVFNNGRLGVNTLKNFSPYAQILRRGRHDVKINLPLIVFICL